MPIEVRYGPDPATVGRAAAYAGYGQYQQRQQQVALNAQQQQQDYALRVAMAQEQAMMGRAQFALAYQQAADRSQLAWAGDDLANARAEADYRSRQDQLDQQVQLARERQAGYDRMNESRERIADKRNETELEKIETRYTAAQKAELEKLNRQINYLVQNEGKLFTPEQVQQGIVDLQMQQRRVASASRLMVNTDQKPDLATEFQQQTYLDERTGVLFAKGPNGWKPLHKPGQGGGMSFRDFSEALRSIKEQITDRNGQLLPEYRRSGPDGQMLTSEEVAMSELQRRQAMFQQLAGGQPGGGSSAPGPGTADGPPETRLSPAEVIEQSTGARLREFEKDAINARLTPEQAQAVALENGGKRVLPEPGRGGQQPAQSQPGSSGGQRMGPPAPNDVLENWEQNRKDKGWRRHADLTPELDGMLAEWWIENAGNPTFQNQITEMRQIVRKFGLDETNMPADVRRQYRELRYRFGLEDDQPRQRQPFTGSAAIAGQGQAQAPAPSTAVEGYGFRRDPVRGAGQEQPAQRRPGAGETSAYAAGGAMGQAVEAGLAPSGAEWQGEGLRQRGVKPSAEDIQPGGLLHPDTRREAGEILDRLNASDAERRRQWEAEDADLERRRKAGYRVDREWLNNRRAATERHKAQVQQEFDAALQATRGTPAAQAVQTLAEAGVQADDWVKLPYAEFEPIKEAMLQAMRSGAPIPEATRRRFLEAIELRTKTGRRR